MTVRENLSSALLIAVFSLGVLYGVISSNVSPLQIGALVDELKFSSEAAGQLVTLELMTAALVSLLFSFLMNRLSCFSVAIGGAAIVIAGQVATAFATDYNTLLILRMLTAIGLGSVYCATVTAMARTKHPDKMISLSTVGSLLALFLLLPFLARILGTYGFKGMYLSLALLFLISLPLLYTFRQFSVGEKISSEIKELPRIRLSILILAIIVFSIGSGAAWVFVERAGTNLGLSTEQIGNLIAFSTLAAIAGAFSVSAIPERLGKTIPAIISLLLLGGGCFLITNGYNILSYQIGSIVYWISYMFVYVLMIAIAASMDTSGRSAAAAGGALLLSFSMGPIVGGYIIQNFSFQTLAIFALGTCVVAAVIIVPLTLLLDKPVLLPD